MRRQVELQPELPVASSQNGSSVLDSHADFWRIWNDHVPFLELLCLRLMKGNASEAHDLRQEGLLKALDAHLKSPITEKSNPRAWLVKVMWSCRADRYRHLQRSPVVSIDPDVLARLQLMAVDPTPEQQFHRGEIQARIRAAMANLPEKLRYVAEMRVYEQMPHQDIAEFLGITAANSRKRWSEARTRLLDWLSQEHPGRSDRRLPDAPESDVRAGREADPRLREPAFDAGPTPRHATPVAVDLPGQRQVEAIVFRAQRPIRLDQQIERCRNYIQRHPGGWKKRRELAYLLEANGMWMEAVQVGRGALEKHPQALDLYLSVGLWEAQLGRTEAARETYRAGMRPSLDRSWGYHFQARDLQLAGRWEEALKCADLAVRFDPREARHRCLLAELQCGLGQASAAVEMLLGPARLCPSDRAEAHWLLKGLQASGQTNGLRRWLPSLETRFPEDPLLLACRIGLRLDDGCFNGEEGRITRSHLRKLRQLAPQSIAYFQSAISFYRLRGQSARVLSLLEDIARSFPRHYSLLTLARDQYAQMGYPALAEALSAQIQALFPAPK